MMRHKRKSLFSEMSNPHIVWPPTSDKMLLTKRKNRFLGKVSVPTGNRITTALINTTVCSSDMDVITGACGTDVCGKKVSRRGESFDLEDRMSEIRLLVSNRNDFYKSNIKFLLDNTYQAYPLRDKMWNAYLSEHETHIDELIEFAKELPTESSIALLCRYLSSTYFVKKLKQKNTIEGLLVYLQENIRVADNISIHGECDDLLDLIPVEALRDRMRNLKIKFAADIPYSFVILVLIYIYSGASITTLKIFTDYLSDKYLFMQEHTRLVSVLVVYCLVDDKMLLNCYDSNHLKIALTLISNLTARVVEVHIQIDMVKLLHKILNLYIGKIVTTSESLSNLLVDKSQLLHRLRDVIQWFLVDYGNKSILSLMVDDELDMQPSEVLVSLLDTIVNVLSHLAIWNHRLAAGVLASLDGTRGNLVPNMIATIKYMDEQLVLLEAEVLDVVVGKAEDSKGQDTHYRAYLISRLICPLITVVTVVMASKPTATHIADESFVRIGLYRQKLNFLYMAEKSSSGKSDDLCLLQISLQFLRQLSDRMELTSEYY